MSKQIHVGSVPVGGGADIAIQSMCNTRTEDVAATVAQILRLEAAGCDIVRVAVPDMAAAQAVGRITPGTSTSRWWRISTSITGWRWSACGRASIRSASTPATSAHRRRCGPWQTPAAVRVSPSASVSTVAHWSGNCCKNTAASLRRRWWRVPWAMSAC